MMRMLMALGALALLATACGEAEAAVALPARIVPAALNGYQIEEDSVARSGFHISNSLVSQGRLFTFRFQGYVYGALEVGSLRGKVDATDIDQQQHIRQQIGSGNFRFSMVAGQWIGEQDTQDDRVFVWFPDFGAHNTFEVLTLTTDFPAAHQMIAAIIGYQETGT